jgi:hypothetical protein
VDTDYRWRELVDHLAAAPQRELLLPGDIASCEGIMRSGQTGERKAMIQLEVGLRKAIEWISQSRQDDPATSLVTLIEAACRKFDLSPIQADFLYRHFTQ